MTDEPKVIQLSPHMRSIKPATGGFIVDAGEGPYHSGLTSDFGYMFQGVEIPKGSSIENRRVALFMCQEWMFFLEKIGWYEHTADWDQHAEIHLYDGRWTHNDGVFLKLDPDQANETQGIEGGVPTHVVLESVWASGEEHDEGTASMLKEFGRNVRGEDLSVSTDPNALIGDLYIPIELIHKVDLGWCT